MRSIMKDNASLQKCTGCGTRLQLHSPGKIGFIQPKRFEKAVMSRNLRVENANWGGNDQSIMAMLKNEIKAPQEVLDEFSRNQG